MRGDLASNLAMWLGCTEAHCALSREAAMDTDSPDVGHRYRVQGSPLPNRYCSSCSTSCATRGRNSGAGVWFLSWWLDAGFSLLRFFSKQHLITAGSDSGLSLHSITAAVVSLIPSLASQLGEVESGQRHDWNIPNLVGPGLRYVAVLSISLLAWGMLS